MEDSVVTSDLETLGRHAHESDGNSENPDAQLYELFPYQVNDPGSANDKMWVFDKKKATWFLTPAISR